MPSVVRLACLGSASGGLVIELFGDLHEVGLLVEVHGEDPWLQATLGGALRDASQRACFAG
jgi:hypothetical protein